MCYFKLKNIAALEKLTNEIRLIQENPDCRILFNRQRTIPENMNMAQESYIRGYMSLKQTSDKYIVSDNLDENSHPPTPSPPSPLFSSYLFCYLSLSGLIVLFFSWLEHYHNNMESSFISDKRFFMILFYSAVSFLCLHIQEN